MSPSLVNWDKASVDSEISRLVAGVAAGARVSLEQLGTSGHNGLGAWRSLGVTLCWEVVGRDESDLAAIFDLDPRTIRQKAYELAKSLAKVKFREAAEATCLELERRLPRTPEQIKWAVESVPKVWDEAGKPFDLTGDQLVAATHDRALVSLRYLAADVCLRLPGMTQPLLMKHLQFSSGAHQARRSELPGMLIGDPDLRWCDREMGDLFHVPIRVESRIE